MNRDDLERRLMAFINDRLRRPENAIEVEPATALFDCGVIDSLQVLALIAFVEETLGIVVPDRQVRLRNFRSVRCIAETFCEKETG